MLKIQRTSNEQVVFALSSQMDEEHIAELEPLIRPEANGRRIVPDLKDLTLVGQEAISILERLFAIHLMRGSSPVPNKPTLFPKWRLKRAIDYIEANITRPIYFAEVSSAAGLTRMHFDAQFRTAIGCSPSNYILKRKVAHSQQLLLDPHLSIADVAATMGFSTQAHYSVVFKRMVGETPARWRESVR